MSEREKEMKANREKDKGNEVCLFKKRPNVYLYSGQN